MRKYLNNEVYDLLPDKLKEVITEREIVQKVGSKEYVSYDNLWLPSATELGYEASADVKDANFPIFKDTKSRVKQLNGETVSYWDRSPITSYSSCFHFIRSNGDIVYYNGCPSAIYLGVCPCFCIG